MSETKVKKKKSNMLEEFTGLGAIFGGIVAGNLITIGADKFLKLKDVPLSGFASIKRFIPPAVKIVGGGAGAYFVPNKTARLVLGGVAISGATDLLDEGIQKILDKTNPSVAGFGEIEAEPIDVYREDMVLENYNPDLPDLSLEEAKDNNLQVIEQVGTISRTPIYEDDEFDEAEIM